jgi:hypothetical protein
MCSIKSSKASIIRTIDNWDAKSKNIYFELDMQQQHKLRSKIKQIFFLDKWKTELSWREEREVKSILTR